jgi:hypothetical protein
MPDHDYSSDKTLREGLTELLQEHGYAVEAFSLADKPTDGDEERTLTLKATRSLTFKQEHLFSRVTITKAHVDAMEGVEVSARG